MAEGFRRQETRFGHVLLQHAFHGAAYSLGLYEAPDAAGHALAFRGSFLRPVRHFESQDPSSGEWIDWDREPLPSVPIGVELTADAEAVATWRTMLSRAVRSESRFLGEEFRLSNPVTEESYVAYWELSPSFRYPERTLWAGRLGEEHPEYNFVLEQYGSWEVTILLLAFAFLVAYPANIVLQSWLCHRRALEECGEGNIKLCEFNNAITGIDLHAEGGCHFECFGPRRPPSEADLAKIARYFPGSSPEEVEERFGKLSERDRRRMLEALQTVEEIRMRNFPSLPLEEVKERFRELPAEPQRRILAAMRTLEKLSAEQMEEDE